MLFSCRKYKVQTRVLVPKVAQTDQDYEIKEKQKNKHISPCPNFETTSESFMSCVIKRFLWHPSTIKAEAIISQKSNGKEAI